MLGIQCCAVRCVRGEEAEARCVGQWGKTERLCGRLKKAWVLVTLKARARNEIERTDLGSHVCRLGALQPWRTEAGLMTHLNDDSSGAPTSFSSTPYYPSLLQLPCLPSENPCGTAMKYVLRLLQIFCDNPNIAVSRRNETAHGPYSLSLSWLTRPNASMCRLQILTVHHAVEHLSKWCAQLRS